MARDGYRIFDSDTHVGPDAAILSAYLSASEKDRLAGLTQPPHESPLLHLLPRVNHHTTPQSTLATPRDQFDSP